MGKYMRKCGRGIGAVAVMEVTTEAVGVRTRARALALAAAGGAPGGRDVAGRKRRKVDGAGGEFRVSYLQLRSRSLILTPAKNRKAAAGSAAADAVAAVSEAPASSRCSEKAGNSGAVDGGCGSSGGGGEWDRVSRCSSNESSEVVAPAEKASSGSGRSRATAEVDDCSETSACNYDAGLQRCRDRTPSSEQRERESDDLESTARPGESGGGRRRNAASAAAVAAASGRSAPLMPSEAEIEDFFAVAEKQEWQRFAQKYNYDVVKDVPLQGRYEWVQIKP